jgi:hypothetical protein
VTAVAAGAATITVTTNQGGLTATCAVTVNSAPLLSVSTSSVQLPAAGGQQTVSISSNISWTVNYSGSWLTVDPTSGAGNGAITLTASANDGSNARTATVRIDGAGMISQTITVTQASASSPEPPVVILPTSVSLNRTTMQLVAGETGQLSATVLPATAENRNVTWSSSRPQVATVSADGLVTAVSAGTAVITVRTEAGNRTAACTVTVEAQGIVAQPTPPANSRGSVEVSLNIPVNEPFSISFTLALPAGFLLDQSATRLADELTGTHQLRLSAAGANSWLFEIEPKVSLRSAEETVYQQVVHIVYTLDGTATVGNYELNISNINLTLSSSQQTVHQDEITIPVNLTDATGLERIEAPEILYYNSRLIVRTAQAERIDVYSVTGQLFYQSQKTAGEATFDLSSLPRGVLIVRGSSGWAKKVYK